MHNRKLKRRYRIILWLLIGMLAAFIGFIIYFSVIAIDHPPVVNDLTSLEFKRTQHSGTFFTFGNNWLRKSESGLWEMYIEGDPFDRGVAIGKLTKELLYYQESAFVEQIKELVPSTSYLKFLRYFVAWFNRNLDKNITDEFKHEIYGISFSCSSEFDFIGSGYQRQLNYHAAHDIGHALQGLNMVGCTSFACWKDKSADSSLIIGRNFDFYAGKKFAENKIVCFYNPSKGYKFMMITWAGMIGVVSGMNEKGLTVTINAAKSSIPGQAKTPVSLLAREILQYASSIDEAYAIAIKRKLFVSESLLIGSEIDGKSAIIEKSPKKYDIVYSSGNSIVCANHFQGKAFLNDKINIENIKGSDSYYRFKRMVELINKNKVIDEKTAVTILRDRYGLNDKILGMGNPLAINQLIAHHAVVFKPKDLTAWVSTYPYQIGEFVAYDMRKVFSMNKKQVMQNAEIFARELNIPADSFLYSIDYENYRKYLEMTEKLKKMQKSKSPVAHFFEDEYIKTNPDLYMVYFNLAEYFRETEDFDKACEYYNKALSKEIAGEDNRKEINLLLQKTLKKTKNVHTRN
jgi:hypothetical protein